MTTESLRVTAAALAHEERGAGFSLLGRLRRAWADHRRYRRTVRELGSLSTRDLEDIGLDCQDVPAAARSLCER